MRFHVILHQNFLRTTFFLFLLNKLRWDSSKFRAKVIKIDDHKTILSNIRFNSNFETDYIVSDRCVVYTKQHVSNWKRILSNPHESFDNLSQEFKNLEYNDDNKRNHIYIYIYI